MATIEFEWKPSAKLSAVAQGWGGELDMSDTVLERNVRWFISVRWFVIALLVVVQLAIVSANELLAHIGIIARGFWPLVIAGVLTGTNFLFSLFYFQPGLRLMVHLHANLWAQIIVDLLCLTALVHYCGSVATPSPFLYIVHIVLSCVFFTTRSSCKVVVLAIIFYLSMVAAELFGAFEQQSVFAALAGPVPLISRSASVFWAGVLSLGFLAVWYIVSKLSIVIRTRESQLIEAHEQLRKAQEEKDRYAVQMTHQLKSPLDAVRSTIALITGGYSGEVSLEARGLLSRIEKRIQGMAGLIIDVLKLARVKESAGARELCNIGNIIKQSIENIQPVANSREIIIDTTIENIEVLCVADQIEMLFDNIISNAVTYSKNGQTVSIVCTKDPHKNKAVVTIIDRGIGIEPQALSHIFDEYFRALDAVRHNNASSGIGLAIVKTIAQSHGLVVRVDSIQGSGTTFTIEFP